MSGQGMQYVILMTLPVTTAGRVRSRYDMFAHWRYLFWMPEPE